MEGETDWEREKRGVGKNNEGLGLKEERGLEGRGFRCIEGYGRSTMGGEN